VPFGERIISPTFSKKRWLVVDFFTTDDFITHYITLRENEFNPLNQGETDEFNKELEQTLLIAQRMWNWNHTNNEWGKKEMIQQNKTIKQLYTDIFREININNE